VRFSEWLRGEVSINQMGMNEMPPQPPAIQEKKGIPPLGWVGIGCGTLVIIAVLVISLLIGWCKKTVGDLADFRDNPEKAAAEMMVRFNPDVEKVSENDATGEMTIRTKDGKEVTLGYKDISEGRFTMVDGEGNTMSLGKTDLKDVPSWVPRVPELKGVSASMRNVEDGKVSGMYVATTSEAVESLETFFKAEAETLGFTRSSSRSTRMNGAESRSQTYSGGGKTLNIVITVNPGEDTQVNVGYEEGK
jgi:hypothetical protein